MSRKDELIAALRSMAGTPSELAAALGVEAGDATFRRALKDLEAEGVLVAEGEARARRYRNTVAVDVDGELLAVLPCDVHTFSDRAHALGLGSHEIHARKMKLEIETYKDEEGRWHCRHTPGYRFTTAAQDYGIQGGPRVIVDGVVKESAAGIARTEAFGIMGPRAGKGGKIIGARPKS